MASFTTGASASGSLKVAVVVAADGRVAEQQRAGSGAGHVARIAGGRADRQTNRRRAAGGHDRGVLVEGDGEVQVLPSLVAAVRRLAHAAGGWSGIVHG